MVFSLYLYSSNLVQQRQGKDNIPWLDVLGYLGLYLRSPTNGVSIASLNLAHLPQKNFNLINPSKLKEPTLAYFNKSLQIFQAVAFV